MQHLSVNTHQPEHDITAMLSPIASQVAVTTSNTLKANVSCDMQADRRIVIATAMIVIGCIVLVAFGNHQSRPLTTQQLIDYFQE